MNCENYVAITSTKELFFYIAIKFSNCPTRNFKNKVSFIKIIKMTFFVCNECGYRFESETGKRCPYCASEKVEKEKTAEELVENSETE